MPKNDSRRAGKPKSNEGQKGLSQYSKSAQTWVCSALGFNGLVSETSRPETGMAQDWHVPLIRCSLARTPTAVDPDVETGSCSSKEQTGDLVWIEAVTKGQPAIIVSAWRRA